MNTSINMQDFILFCAVVGVLFGLTAIVYLLQEHKVNTYKKLLKSTIKTWQEMVDCDCPKCAKDRCRNEIQ